ncbi:hypothetical protein MRX96_052167 [Rhipicephalus microplus]
MTSTISRQELEKHNAEDDAWILFRGEVYDVTKYVKEHPGGLAIVRYAGKDASSAIKEQPAHRCVLLQLHPLETEDFSRWET